MEYTIFNNMLTIKLVDRIDTSNADQFGCEMSKIINENPANEIIFDLEKLKYISSAGLRQILRIKKTYKNISMINANSDVYEIFDTTGFTEMIPIEKAYKEISVEGCEVIGEGSNGIVYRLNEDTIVKVYKNNDAISEIKRERDLARKALVMGVNTAISYDIVKVGDKYGSVFEMLSSKSITHWINSDPSNIDKYINLYVNFLKEIHSIVVINDQLPSEKIIQINRAKYLKDYLDEEHYTKLISFYDSIPEDDHMIHGDYHPGNIHYDGNEVILIDMDTISHGNNIFEFASIYNALQAFSIVDKDNIKKFLKIDYDVASYIWRRTCELYFNTKNIDEIENKIKILSFSRILRRTLKRDSSNAILINESKKQLILALDKIQ